MLYRVSLRSKLKWKGGPTSKWDPWPRHNHWPTPTWSSMQWSSFLNNWWGRQNSICWQCMVYYKHLWNVLNGNTCPLYVHAGPVIMHGRLDVTLLGFAAHDVLSLRLANVCGIHIPTMIQLTLIIRSVQGCNIISTSPQLILEPKFNSHTGLADAAFHQPLSRFTWRIHIHWNQFSL